MSFLNWGPTYLGFGVTGAQRASVNSTSDDVIFVEGASASSTCPVTGLSECVSDADAANKKYVDDEIAKIVLGSGFVTTDATNQTKSGQLNITNSTNSTNDSTGAFVVAGGVGVGQDIHCGGNMNALTFITGSDINLKAEVEDIKDPLTMVNELEPKTYVMKNSRDRRYGIIAQDVLNSSLKDVVDTNGDYLSVDYNSLVGVLIGAVRELSARVEELENK